MHIRSIMPRSTMVATLGLLSALAVPARTAQAQLTATNPACANASSLTLFTPDAIACSGSWAGNNVGTAADLAASLSQIQADFLGFVGNGTWSYIGTTNAGQTTGPFSNVPGAPSGTVTFDNPMTGFFVLALKSSTHFSFYLLDGGTQGLSSVDFVTLGTSLNPKGKAQDLSHVSLYDFDPATTTTATPEPASLVLMVTGLVGVAGAVKRRRRA